jgi:hypothetical protein
MFPKLVTPATPYVISAFPNRTGAGGWGRGLTDDLRALVLDPLRGCRQPIVKFQDLIERILVTCFGVLDKMESDESLRFLHMFEESIGSLVS